MHPDRLDSHRVETHSSYEPLGCYYFQRFLDFFFCGKIRFYHFGGRQNDVKRFLAEKKRVFFLVFFF